MNRTDRLMGILLEMQARGELRAEDLAATFEVSVRTIYRDVQALSETGVPIVATPGKGYRLIEGYFLPPLSFTDGEATALVLGGEFVRDRVDPALRAASETALRKLAGVLSDERRAEVTRRRGEILFAVTRHADGERLAQLREAVEQRRVTRLLYHAYRREEPEPREVEPVKLVFLAETWHLAAWCRMRQAPRIFRLDRIDRLQLLDERFHLTERHAVDPDGHDRLDEFPTARVRFGAEVERWVRERQPYFFVGEERDAYGSVFRYALRDERELVSWLLTWGAASEVIEPVTLRARIASEARAILLRHLDSEDRDDLPEPNDATAEATANATAITLSGASRYSA